jgi:predicted DNA repair protein MutK
MYNEEISLLAQLVTRLVPQIMTIKTHYLLFEGIGKTYQTIEQDTEGS